MINFVTSLAFVHVGIGMHIKQQLTQLKTVNDNRLCVTAWQK